MLLTIVLLGICLLMVSSLDAKEPYIIGVQSDVTGRGSGSYAVITEGVRLYFEALNDRGGINGHPVKVIYEDNKSDPARASALATKMILEDNVLAICMMSFSPSHMPVYELAKKHGVPVISPWSCPVGVWDPVKNDCREIFATGMVMSPKMGPKSDSFDYIGYVGATIVDKLFPKTKTVGCISYDTVGARNTTRWWAKWSEKNGFKVVYTGDIPPGTLDASTWAMKIVESKPDILIATSGGDLLTFLYPTVEKLGWRGILVLPLIFTSKDSFVKGLELSKKLQENVYLVCYSIPFDDIPVPGSKEIIDAMKKYGHKFLPSPLQADGWIVAGVVAEALARAGWPCSRSDLLKALEKTNFDTKGLTGGPIQFSPTNHYGPQYLISLKWDHMKKKFIRISDWIKFDPVEVAKVSDFVYEK
jgi:ABC-type branched-subunit amino acid transport system substrate-binding protein